MAKSLEELLEEYSVMAPGEWINDLGPKDWYALVDNRGIFAYFETAKDALRYRLVLINFHLNPLEIKDE